MLLNLKIGSFASVVIMVPVKQTFSMLFIISVLPKAILSGLTVTVCNRDKRVFGLKEILY